MPQTASKNVPMTAFSMDPPMGLWDTSKLGDGLGGPMLVVGGSSPDMGKTPWDDFSDQTSLEAFFGAQTFSENQSTDQL